MARQGRRSLLRRRGAPVGALAVLCVVLAVPARAATPSPDPPPNAVTPEPPPVTRTQPAPVRSAPATVAPAPVVHRAAPVVRAQPVQAPAREAEARREAEGRREAKPKVVAQPAAAKTRPCRTTAPACRSPRSCRRPTSSTGVCSRSPASRCCSSRWAAPLCSGAARRRARCYAARRGRVLPALVLATGGSSDAERQLHARGTARLERLVHEQRHDSLDRYETGSLTSTPRVRSSLSTSRPRAPSSPRVSRTVRWSASTTPIGDDQDRQDGAAGVCGATPARAAGLGRLVQPSRRASRSAGTDAASGHRGLLGPTYSAAATAPRRARHRHVHRRRRQHERTGERRVQVRRDTRRPSRPPSIGLPTAKGWYRKPVTVSFAGTDVTSGIAACTAPTRYAGPDQPKAAVVGSCRDAAGNSAEAGQTFQYDATAPALAKTEAKVDKGVARIGWERAGDVVEVELLRSPGHQRREVDDRLQRQRRCVRRQDSEGRHPLPLRDQRRRPGGQRHDEGGHGRGGGGHEEHGPPRARRGIRREGAAAAPLEGGEGRDVLQRPAVPERRQGAEHVARRGQAQARAGRGRTAASSSGSRPATTRWYVWGARGTRAKPVYGKVLGSSTFTVKR